MNAVYVIVEDTYGEPLVIRDVGHRHGRKTIINDVEAVLLNLVQKGHIHRGRRLFYFDSEDLLAEIVHDGVSFVRFSPMPI